jgi:hypothetical protein
MEAANGLTLPVPHAFLKKHGALLFGTVNGILAFLLLTGLGIWLLPFSVTAQASVLLHTLMGLLVVFPFTIWQLSHWLATRKAAWRFRKFCAYAGFWILASNIVSGVLLSWQAIFSLNISHLWDGVHLWSGIAAVSLIAVHAWPGPKTTVVRGANHPPEGTSLELSAGRRRIWTWVAGMAGAFLVFLAGLAAFYQEPDYTHYKLPAGYQLPFGKDPFAPSLATTVSGQPLAPQILSQSESCGASGCHTAIYREWRASAHQWSSEDKFFQAVQKAMISEEGIPAARYCAGCHDPVSLLSAYKDASTGIEAPGFKEGDSCVICHSMVRVDVQGNGNYVFAPPKPYFSEYGNGRFRQAIAHFLIRAYPWQHDSDYSLTLDQQPVSCASCHKQFINKQINHVGWVQLQNQYDEWRTGKWNTNPNLAGRLHCQDCHMYYVTASVPRLADPYDREAGLGLKHRNHWFAAANQIMPAMIHSYDAGGQITRVNAWLKGQVVIPEISGIWPQGPVIPIQVEAPSSAQPGQKVDLRAVVTNNKAGHDFATGPLDLIRAWIEIEVRDRGGHVLFHSGALTAQNHVEAGTIVLRSIGVNPEGNPIVRHHLWHYVGTISKRSIVPGYSDMYEYQFTIPRQAVGPLEVTARLRYRKANQYFMNFVFPKQMMKAPITDLSSTRAQIALAGRSSGKTTRPFNHPRSAKPMGAEGGE